MSPVGRAVDSGSDGEASSVLEPDLEEIDWARCLPFALLHLACGAVFLVGVSPVAVAVAGLMYVFHMFAITAFYHRYFSHRAFRTSRVVQFLGAVAATSSAQRGPLWWAAHHRHHHVHSDGPQDTHSPGRRGLLMSHVGWFMTKGAYRTPERYVRDWKRYPELRFINRFDWLSPTLLGTGLFLLGAALERWAPGLGTSGWQMFVWGFVVSTVVVYHATYTINSLAHRYGSRRYETGDDSRNNFWLAILTMGEGWHNNHHHYPASARQGFRWWEIDLTYYGLVVLERLGVIWDLRGVPRRVLAEGGTSGGRRDVVD
ncbi:MAG: acyl-CoA desaturase [Phycisphaerales bacterium]|nr:acyl-CoA desaturase [Phycisphaerales bacterium]